MRFLKNRGSCEVTRFILGALTPRKAGLHLALTLGGTQGKELPPTVPGLCSRWRLKDKNTGGSQSRPARGVCLSRPSRGAATGMNLQPMSKNLSRCYGLAVAAAFCALAAGLTAKAEQIGSASGLPIPRYVSLKSDRVNLREGPSKDHRTIWVFQRAGLPVEITAEFEIWRKVRDSDGAEGWVLHSLLSGRRTALVAPWKKGVESILYGKASAKSAPVAKLQSNVIANVRGCNGAWCRITGEGFDGYIEQANLWGVYPYEKIE
jgi:SH3-like domain-containing protein